MVLGLKHTLRKLETYNNSQYPILSVHLDTTSKDPLQKQFRELLEKLLSQSTRMENQYDITFIDAFLETYNSPLDKKGVAFFSGGNNLWEVICTPFSLKKHLTIDHSPLLTPIIEGLSQDDRYLVIVADKVKAKLFTVHKGMLEDQADIYDTSVLEKVKITGQSDKEVNTSQHNNEHLRSHFHAISNKITEFARKKAITGVLIGGHKEFMHRLEQALPKELQEKIKGRFVSELNISLNQIVTHSQEIINQLNDVTNHSRPTTSL